MWVIDQELPVKSSIPVENASDEEERERTKKDRSQAVLSRHEIETMAHDKTRVFISGVPHRTPSNCTGLNTMQSDLVFSHFFACINNNYYYFAYTAA